MNVPLDVLHRLVPMLGLGKFRRPGDITRLVDELLPIRGRRGRPDRGQVLGRGAHHEAPDRRAAREEHEIEPLPEQRLARLARQRPDSSFWDSPQRLPGQQPAAGVDQPRGIGV